MSGVPMHRSNLGRFTTFSVFALAQWVGFAAQGSAQEPAAERTMAVTFDDLPANTLTQTRSAQREILGGLIAALRRTGIPSIGFVNEVKLYDGGTLDPGRVALLQEWLDAGYELGNHTFSHPDLHDTPVEEYQDNIRRGEVVTRPLVEDAGRQIRYFRHPMLHTGRSGEVKAQVLSTLDSLGYRVAPVTIDNQEWVYARAYENAVLAGDSTLAARIRDSYLDYMDQIVRYYEDQSRALLGYELPQVLLLHANRLALESVGPLIETWRARGYRFITLDQALADSAYGTPDEYQGPSGITWLHRWALTQGKSGSFFAGESEVPAFVQSAFRGVPDPGGAP